MRYIGSKAATLDALGELVRARAPTAKSICDPFAGTCTVARYFKRAGMRIVTGDILALSHVIQRATIGLNAPPSFLRLRSAGILREPSSRHEEVIRHLSSLRPRRGYVTKNFSPVGSEGRLFFTPQNAGIIDAVRTEIAKWSEATLITAGTYYAHLKELDRKARKELELRPLEIVNNGIKNTCHLGDALSVSSVADTDILYLDPPYNGRDYLGYYHLPETIVRGDRAEPQGRSGAPRLKRAPRSVFCRLSTATTSMQRLVQNSSAKHVVVHYTTRGLIPHRRLLEMLRKLGRTTHHDIPVRSYSATRSMVNTTTTHRIYWCERSVL
jgi:adenine-specific DNA-methyltransferase